MLFVKPAVTWSNINGIFELETLIVSDLSYWSYNVKTIFSLDNHVVVNLNKLLSVSELTIRRYMKLFEHDVKPKCYRPQGLRSY